MPPDLNPFHLPLEFDDPALRSVLLEPRWSRFWEKKERAWRKARIDPEFDRRSYVDLFIAHRGCCGVCGVFWRRTGKLLAADHSHATGKARGLLCSTCNYDMGKREAAISCGARIRWTPAQFVYLKRSEAGLELLSLARW